jgi:hypothetical protein
MNKFFVIIFVLVLFISCTTPSKADIENVPSENEYDGFSIEIDNPTFFNITIDNQELSARTKDTVKIIHVYNNELSSGYDITYEVSLNNSIPSLFCKGDNIKIRKEQTSVIINTPVLKDNYGCYIVIKNKANSAIGFGIPTGNSFTTIPAVIRKSESDPRYEFSSNETAIYQLDNNTTSTSKYAIKDGKNNILFNSLEIKKNYIYEYEYSVGKLIFIDARPLTRIGEPTWSRKTDGVPVFAEYGDRSIKVIASAETINAVTLNAAGEEINKTDNKTNGSNAVISGVAKTEDAYITAGYTAGNLPRSIVEKRSLDDVLVWTIPFVQKKGVFYTKLYTLAQKDQKDQKNKNTYLAAGTAGSNGMDDGAYIMEISDKETRGEILWELTPEDSKSRNWKTIWTASYNAKNDTYILAGDCGKDTTFVGFVDSSGHIKGKDVVINNFLVSQIVSDADDAFYVMGQEFRSGKSYAIVRKYDITGKMLWQQTSQLKEDALYQCAVFDEDAVVLGGVMNAADEFGSKGVPFLQSIDGKTGNELWIESIKDIPNVNIVTGLQKAVDYGFIATLAKAENMGNARIIRLNARGKLVNHKPY